MKRIIVTGGSGFVGSALVHHLVKDKYDVHVFVRTTRSLSRLEDLKGKATIHENILTDAKKTLQIVKKIQPYGVCHLATYGSYPSQKDIELTIENNVSSTLHLFEALRQTKVAHVLIAGSSSEYGKKAQPMKETDLLEPNNLYAAAKAMQTHLAQVYAWQYQLPATILRLFNVYGPREEEGRLVRNVIEKALKNENIPLATGMEARDFIHVDDIANAFAIFLEEDHSSGSVFNLGTGVQSTIHELPQMVVQLTHSKSKILLNVYEGRPWDSPTWKADMTKTFAFTKWRPLFNVYTGLQHTIEWYKRQL